MGTLLGKTKHRKRKTDSEADVEDAQAIFRRHFETQFKPLQGAAPREATAKASREPEVEEDEEDSDSDSDSDSEAFADSEWEGIAEDENDEEPNAVEVIDHRSSTPTTATSTMTKRELRAYLSSRPPSAFDDDSAAQRKSKSSKNKDDTADPEDEDSATLLANDLALQRLISESKILSSAAASPSADRAFAEGRTRRVTTDMRLQALGSRDSVLAQKNMPMSIRKGIAGAAATREEKRRREAKENGIILERAIGGGGKRKLAGKRRRGGGGGGGGTLAVDMPGVGRMRGAELRLSQRDIRSMETPREKPGGKKKRRRT